MQKTKRRRPTRPASRPDGRKRNPNTLCQVLTQIRENIHLLPIAPTLGIDKPLNRQDFAELVLRPAALRRKEFAEHAWSEDTVEDIEGNDKNLRFIDLQLYADIVGIPIALLLLFSRMRANERDAQKQKPRANEETNSSLFSAVREILAVTRPSELPITTLGEWSTVVRKYGVASPTPFGD
jgi:hypothetical protein